MHHHCSIHSSVTPLDGRCLVFGIMVTRAKVLTAISRKPAAKIESDFRACGLREGVLQVRDTLWSWSTLSAFTEHFTSGWRAPCQSFYCSARLTLHHSLLCILQSSCTPEVLRSMFYFPTWPFLLQIIFSASFYPVLNDFDISTFLITVLSSFPFLGSPHLPVHHFHPYFANRYQSLDFVL
jgi:hypothetical protein